MVNEIVPAENLEKMGQGKKRNHSKFSLGAPFAQTHRYGEYDLVKTLNIIPDDGKIRVRIPCDLRSYTLKAPMMQNMRMKQDLFFIPHMAILPNSSDYIITNPTQGDDVPTDANTVVMGFRKKIQEITDAWTTLLLASAGNLIDADTKKDKGLVNALLHHMIWTETFYSAGSLLTYTEYPMGELFNYSGGNTKTKKNFGTWFDKNINYLVELSKNNDYIIGRYIDNNNVQWIVYADNYVETGGIPLRTALCWMRERADWTFQFNQQVELLDFVEDVVTNGGWFDFSIKEIDDSEVPFNYEKLVAYQIACAHFYSNDHIDYIYSAELWRQNMRSIYVNIEGREQYYNRNGIGILYDAISGSYVNTMITEIYNSIYEAESYPEIELPECLNYIYNIFSRRRSLRFKDYFTGARSQPLAVGDVSVAVDNNKVSVVDVTRNIQLQRFLNASNRAGNKLESYIKEIFGIEPKPDWHNPFWLGHTTDFIGNPETENTATEQYEMEVPITSAFRMSSGSKEFSLNFDRYGVFIVIRYFDIPRLYYRGANRTMFIKDRFDMFIPEMQYIGDQPIYMDELVLTEDHDETFGYATRDSEFKQQVGRAMGGFVHNLPGFVFLADHNRGQTAHTDNTQHISPEYIRSIPTELDEFYNILTGYSLETYFHFMCVSSIIIDASRPMAFQPQILK